LPADEFDTTFDRSSTEPLGPYAQNKNHSVVGITNGTCWDDSELWSFEEVQQLAECTLNTFNSKIDAQFLWTARNEIEDKWSYINAWDLGWLKQPVASKSKKTKAPVVEKFIQ
jgi:hypothetical protein